MISSGIVFKKIVLEHGDASSAETAMRLRVPRDFDCSFTERIERELLSVTDCRGVAVRTSVSVRDGEVDLGFLTTQSSDLAKALSGCSEAYVFAVTLGMGVERLLLKYSKTSKSDHFTADALASAYAEAAADKMEKELSYGECFGKRFSPGYGDLSLSIQPKILSALNAEGLLGITLTDGLLMKPEKSITAIVGIRNE